jgi:hypothetical protein
MRAELPMALRDLTDDELQVVRTCLDCVAAGDVILHDADFAVIMGIDVATFLTVVAAWPGIDDGQEDVWLAINNAFNNLLGYPHASHDSWDERIPVPREEVRRVFALWRGGPGTLFPRGP